MFNDPRPLAVLFLFCTSRDFENLAVWIRSKTADFYHLPTKLGKVMFLVVSVCLSTGGSHVTITHVLNLLYRHPPQPPPDTGPHWTGTPGHRMSLDRDTPPSPSPTPTRYGTSPDRDPLASDISWPSLETCSNLFTPGTPYPLAPIPDGHQSMSSRRKQVVRILHECFFFVVNCSSLF